MATLTYSYQDSTIVVGPLSVYREPHTYDLCADHAATVNPPRGWEVLRLDYSSTQQPQEEDDLLALADAVASSASTLRETEGPSPEAAAGEESGAEPVGLPTRESRGRIEPPTPGAAITRGHLRLLKD